MNCIPSYYDDPSNGLFYCPVCGHKSAVWQSDWDAADYGYECDGIVTMYTCALCGADIQALWGSTEQEPQIQPVEGF